IEALFRGGSKWFSGVIDKVNRDGTYDIRYDDGDREPSVPTEKIRVKGGVVRDEERPAGARKRYKKGDKIEGKYRNGAEWLKGEIDRDNLDGTYDLFYDNGKQEMSV